MGLVDPEGSVRLAGDVADLEPHLGDDGEGLARLGERIAASPASVVEMGDLQVLKPVEPASMRDFMVFEEHVLPSWRSQGLIRGPEVWYEQPIGYVSNVACLLGPQEAVEIPGGSQQLDFELEVGAILGREARSVRPEQAQQLIAGFVVLCDWSARDLQMREMEGRLGPFKGKDFASSLGPLLVTPDELSDRRTATGHDLSMVASVNGREYGRDSWSSASWSFEELISYASWNSRLEATALIGSGTCQGGCIRELSLRHGAETFPWLAAGDRVSLCVERLGTLAVDVAPATRSAWPGLRSVPARP